MSKFSFKVVREMHGDRAYVPGDTRELTVQDAAPLLRSGALEPKGADAAKAAEDLLGPREFWGVRQAPGPAQGDAEMDRNNERAAAEGASPTPARTASSRSKDAGDAGKNKADTATPAPGGTGGATHAGEPGATPVTVDPANAGATPAPAPAPAPAAAPTPVAAPARRSGGRSGRRR